MGLHARNIAIAAKVPEELVPEVVEYMKERGDISTTAAQEYMNARAKYVHIWKGSQEASALSVLTMDVPELDPPVKISVAFSQPQTVVHLMVSSNAPHKSDILKNTSEVLLGGKHGYDSVLEFLKLL